MTELDSRHRFNAHRNYTDIMVFVGATQRDAEVDFLHFQRTWPELFLGYEVWVMGIWSARRVCEGLKVSSFYITPRAIRFWEGREVEAILLRSVLIHAPHLFVKLRQRWLT